MLVREIDYPVYGERYAEKTDDETSEGENPVWHSIQALS